MEQLTDDNDPPIPSQCRRTYPDSAGYCCRTATACDHAAEAAVADMQLIGRAMPSDVGAVFGCRTVIVAANELGDVGCFTERI